MQLIGAPAGVKSIQRGTFMLNTSESPKTVAIVSVNMSRAMLLLNGTTLLGGTTASYLSELNVRGKILNPTTLEFTRGTNTGGTNTTIEWQVIEYV